jgi:hypothetical protein
MLLDFPSVRVNYCRKLVLRPKGLKIMLENRENQLYA